MKKIALTLSMIVVFLMNVYSKSSDSTITIQNRKYFQNGQVKSLKEVKRILISNPTSVPEMKKYSAISITGTVIAETGLLVGLVCEGIYLGNNNKANSYYHQAGKFLPISLCGFAVFIGGEIFRSTAKKHLNNAISLYNSKYKSTGFNSVQLDFIANYNGLGVLIKF